MSEGRRRRRGGKGTPSKEKSAKSYLYVKDGKWCVKEDRRGRESGQRGGKERNGQWKK